MRNVGIRLQKTLPGPRHGRVFCDFPKTGMNLQFNVPLFALWAKKRKMYVYLWSCILMSKTDLYII